MANNKHLTLDERITIETMLKQKANITKIANTLDKLALRFPSHLMCAMVVETV